MPLKKPGVVFHFVGNVCAFKETGGLFFILLETFVPLRRGCKRQWVDIGLGPEELRINQVMKMGQTWAWEGTRFRLYRGEAWEGTPSPNDHDKQGWSDVGMGMYAFFGPDGGNRPNVDM